MAKANLTAQRLRELLHYDPETGQFTWAARTNNGIPAGAVAGSVSKSTGYVVICLDGAHYRGHRLAWLWVNGAWPACQIDHRDTIRHHNAINNLREASHAHNSQNQRRPHSNNKTGILGVSWYKKSKKYHAQITVNGKVRHVGYFDTVEQARAAYIAAKRILHAGCTI
jgi:hypothetical protein